MKKQLLIESIRMDGETQSRERISDETVAEYAETMQAPPANGRSGQPWPPVSVFFDGTEYWMADGFHRLLAAKRIGRKHIAADVKQGSREDAAWAACAANVTHGLRRTNADKRKAVEIALKLHPEMSARAISDHCGVGNDLIPDVRLRCRIPTPERVQGKDGKMYRSPRPRAEQTIARSLGPPPAPCVRARSVAAPPSSPSSEPPAPAEKTVAGPVDEIGRRIPEHLVEMWGRRQEVQDMLTALSRVRVAVRNAQDSQDPLFSEIPFSSALAHLDQAFDAVQVAKPYAVCAFCQGHGCKACGQRGLLGKFRWDTTVPREHKEAVKRIVESGR